MSFHGAPSSRLDVAMLGDALTGLGVGVVLKSAVSPPGSVFTYADLTEVQSVRVVVPTLRDQQAVSLSSNAEDHSVHVWPCKLVKRSISRVTIGDFVDLDQTRVPDLVEGRRVLARATPVFEDELQIRIDSVLPDASLRRFGAAPAELRAAHRKARAA